MSATDIVCDLTDGGFGPFGKQLFVGDMMKGTIIRVAMEKVAGEYQGACFLFRRGVGAVNRMTFGPDHRLYLTRAARGWGGGGRGEGVARLEFTGETPMEVRDMHLIRNGFELHFTLPLSNERRNQQLGRTAGSNSFAMNTGSNMARRKIDQQLLPILEDSELSADRTRLRRLTVTVKRNQIRADLSSSVALAVSRER
jgi:hypothetical protein